MKRPPATRSRLTAEDRRRQIVKVATELFRERPFDDISLDEIARAAGVTRPLITHHFGTKRALYMAVVSRVLDVGTLPLPDYVHGMSLRGRLEQSVDEWLENIDRNRELWLDSMRMPGLGDRDTPDVVEQAREHAAARIAAVAGLGPAGELTPAQMAALRIATGVAESATLQWLAYGRLTRDESRTVMVDAFEETLRRLLDAAA